MVKQCASIRCLYIAAVLVGLAILNEDTVPIACRGMDVTQADWRSYNLEPQNRLCGILPLKGEDLSVFFWIAMIN